jgi:hypothetical protein
MFVFSDVIKIGNLGISYEYQHNIYYFYDNTENELSYNIASTFQIFERIQKNVYDKVIYKRGDKNIDIIFTRTEIEEYFKSDINTKINIILKKLVDLKYIQQRKY